MGLLARFLGLLAGTKDEQRFHTVMIGENYFGKLGEEFFDAPTEQAEETAQIPTANSRQSLPAAKAPSSELMAKSPAKPTAPESELSRRGKQKLPGRIPSSDIIEDLVPVLVNLTKLGEELLPLLQDLTKKGEIAHYTTRSGAARNKDSPQASASSDQTRERTPTKTISTKESEASSPTPVPSNTMVKGSESKNFAPTERSEGSLTSTTTRQATPRTRTNSISNRSDPQDTPLKRRSTQEEAAFSSFKRICAAHGFLNRPLGIGEQDVCDGINDEATLRRFFYARKREVSDAHRQFKEAWDAREVNHLCEFYERIDIHDFEETKKLYPHWIGRRDKRGQPLCMFDFGKLDSPTMAAYKKSSTDMKIARSDLKMPGIVSTEMLRAFAVYENLTRFVMPLCTAATGRPHAVDAVTKMVCVVDISGISVKQVWNLRGYLQDLSKLFAANYPEILDRAFIIGAPSYFPTIWAWVKKWVDPNTVAKLCILTPEEVLPTLQQYIDMPNIPKRFGGEFDYQHGMQPSLDPAIANTLTWLPPSAKLPIGSMKWVDGGKEGRVAVAVGSSGGRDRHERIAVLRQKKQFNK